VGVSKRFSAIESPYGIARPPHSEAVQDAKGGLSQLIVKVMLSDLPIQRMYEAIFLFWIAVFRKSLPKLLQTT
jgi:hypothetical protein